MYIVNFKNPTGAIGVNKFEYLDEAQEFIEYLVQEGIMDFTLSREMHVKIRVEVEVENLQLEGGEW